MDSIRLETFIAFICISHDADMLTVLKWTELSALNL